MSFNLGISNHPTSRLGMTSIGIYLYEDIYYRQWITEVALAFYEGRQDEFVWLDLVRQFRNPEKQQILPVNLTKEIIDETSILYREEPIYQVIDEDTGKALPKDQKLWEQIMKDARYNAVMDRVDRWCKLLGTVLIKVSFVNEDTGRLVTKTEPGKVHLDVLHGGVYDVKHGASPYYITELLIGFGTRFQGFEHRTGNISGSITGSGVAATIPDPSSMGQVDAQKHRNVDNIDQLHTVNRIYWSPEGHKVEDNKGQVYETKNPYGLIPAVPFFNADPAHYYFLPINEPLIYANHAVNMRITDLNHIAKFQSFGVPVVSGVERPTAIRQGRPVDDFNQLKGGAAQSRFGGFSGVGGFGPSGNFRNFDAGFGIFRDGNADANALGFSLGPDTAVAVGEKGDFKFAHPSADITGLVKTIHSITDMIRINHGLRPKYEQQPAASGYALMMEKMGVIEENIRRGKLFKEREQQLFTVIKTLWNAHHNESGEKRFSEKAKLEVTYRQPEFPVDPKTKIETLMIEQSLLDTGSRHIIKKLYPHLSEAEVNKLIKENRADKQEQTEHEADTQSVHAKKLKSELGDDVAHAMLGVKQEKKEDGAKKKVAKSKIDNKAKHSADSSKQPKKNGDTRGQKEE
jgi:hypothetical protein